MVRSISLFFFWFFPTFLHAQYVRIGKGSVLKYEVEQYGRHFVYSVTVQEEEPFSLAWQTATQPVYKGQCVHYDSSWYYAERLLVKPVQDALEEPDGASIRLALPLDLCEAANDTLSPHLQCGVDNIDVDLEQFHPFPKIRTIQFNQKPVIFESKFYRDKVIGLQLGLMPFGNKRYWVYSYKDGEVTMQLLSVETPIIQAVSEPQSR